MNSPTNAVTHPLFLLPQNYPDVAPGATLRGENWNQLIGWLKNVDSFRKSVSSTVTLAG